MFLGIEFGGTKLQIGLGPGDGTMARFWRGPVDVAAGGDGIRRQLGTAIPELLRGEPLRGIGVGFGGPVDDDTQTIIKSHQIAGWDNFPLASWLSDMFGLPVALGNDADVAGLAEATFGAGKGLSPIFYVTVGSGIGGGLILDGRIHRGTGRGAAEVGHLSIRKDDGDYDVLEHVASGWGMEAEAKRHGRNWTSVQIGEESARDPLAMAIVDRAIASIAEVLCHVIAMICPKCLVIGGGVPLMGEDLFFEPLRRAVAERV